MAGPRGLAQGSELLDHALAEPGRVGHHSLDRVHQVLLRALAGRDVLEHREDASLTTDRHGLGGDQAGDRGAILRAELRLVAPQGAGPGKRRPKPLPLFHVGPEVQVRRGLAHRILGRIAEECTEGVVDLDDALVARAEDCSRYRDEAECLGEALLGVAQGRLGLPARLEIREGEQHAGRITDLDGLASDDDEPTARVAWHREAGLHLGDRLAGSQALERVFAALRVLRTSTS